MDNRFRTSVTPGTLSAMFPASAIWYGVDTRPLRYTTLCTVRTLTRFGASSAGLWVRRVRTSELIWASGEHSRSPH